MDSCGKIMDSCGKHVGITKKKNYQVHDRTV